MKIDSRGGLGYTEIMWYIFTPPFTEMENEKWKLVFEETVKLPETVFIGPYMSYSAERDPGNFWRAEFDKIEILQARISHI